MKKLLAVVATALALGAVHAQEAKPAERKVLKVCQDPNNLPFSNDKGEGIENRIAQLFGKELGLAVEYFSFPQRMAFIRNTLRYKLPGQDYRCDLVLGVPVGFDQVSATKPYYRSTYAIVFAPARQTALDKVQSGSDFLALPREQLTKLKIGLYDRSPASAWLQKHGLVDSGVAYAMLSADPEQYPGEIIEKDLAAGKIDAAIVWGPIAGFFAKRVTQPALRVVPLRSEPGVRFDYQMAAGVRYGEPEWKARVESFLESKRPEITAILKEYGVPLVDESYGVGTKP
jgi:mxaJ protein